STCKRRIRREIGRQTSVSGRRPAMLATPALAGKPRLGVTVSPSGTRFSREEASDGVDTVDRSDRVVAGRSARLALQPRVGLCAERLAGTASDSPAASDCVRHGSVGVRPSARALTSPWPDTWHVTCKVLTL